MYWLILEYLYKNTQADGCIGGSAFERTPEEKLIINRATEFKNEGQYNRSKLLNAMLNGVENNYDYVEFVKNYVANHYMDEIIFSQLAQAMHISRNYLSKLFSKKAGCTLPEYLIKYRIQKALGIMQNENLPFYEISLAVGYKDYAHFSKSFKKVTGVSPTEYKNKMVRKNNTLAIVK